MTDNPFTSASELLAHQLAQHKRLREHVGQLESLQAALGRGEIEPLSWDCGQLPVEHVLLFAALNERLLRAQSLMTADEQQRFRTLQTDSIALIGRWQAAVQVLGEIAKSWLESGTPREQ